MILQTVCKCQLSVLLLEGKCAVKRQLYTLKEAVSFSTNVALPCLYFAHSCTKHTHQLLPSRSEAKAMPYDEYQIKYRTL